MIATAFVISDSAIGPLAPPFPPQNSKAGLVFHSFKVCNFYALLR